MTTYKVEEPFDPEFLLGTLVMVEFSATGYYSGNSESQVAFFEKDDYETVKDALESYTPYFRELDGKHSEVEGVVTTTYINTMLEFKQCIDSHMNADDHYMIFESCLDCSEYDSMTGMLMETHEAIVSQFETETATEYYVQGVKI